MNAKAGQAAPEPPPFIDFRAILLKDGRSEDASSHFEYVVLRVMDLEVCARMPYAACGDDLMNVSTCAGESYLPGYTLSDAHVLIALHRQPPSYNLTSLGSHPTFLICLHPFVAMYVSCDTII